MTTAKARNLGKYILGGQQFQSKATAEEHAKRIKNGTRVGEYLEGDNLKFMLDALAMHPNAEKKIGCGVKAIQVLPGWYANDKKLEIVRIDGSREEFSLKACFTTASNPKLNYVRKCLRLAIVPQIQEFTKQAFIDGGRSALSGDTLDRTNAQADHKFPVTFEQLIFDFITENNINYNTLEVLDGYILRDDSITKTWQEYHSKNAVLQLLSASENSKQPRAKIKWH